MEASVTNVLTCREGRGQPTSRSSRRSTSSAVTDSDRGRSRCGGCSAAAASTTDVWSTDSSRHVSGVDKSRSRSAEARSRSKCRGCGGSDAMETLDVRLLSPDSGAIVFSETPENELSTTASTTPDWPNEVGVHDLI